MRLLWRERPGGDRFRLRVLLQETRERERTETEAGGFEELATSGEREFVEHFLVLFPRPCTQGRGLG